ncbi:TPA: hypothetical protein DD449_02045 [Candidatus Berkelbacteria bacterium]|uniref:Uncharacterized protein n=1 Tax=Berkelbacteria bacterium GW2011_GWE1_39_12 TaxID=1618337 RepID=A0A0G4B372_9BACT|nr:MAG: hypothetical protein UT28_C0001G0049 [Berkelbacteria bacterium GW2011_GWE1_39_12]HBO60440.1 hypothetical protein [Candidatus Berkelbacteria bacterium]
MRNIILTVLFSSALILGSANVASAHESDWITGFVNDLIVNNNSNSNSNANANNNVINIGSGSAEGSSEANSDSISNSGSPDLMIQENDHTILCGDGCGYDEGSIGSTVVNNNANSNADANANNNVINIGSGSASGSAEANANAESNAGNSTENGGSSDESSDSNGGSNANANANANNNVVSLPENIISETPSAKKLPSTGPDMVLPSVIALAGTGVYALRKFQSARSIANLIKF